MTKIENRCKQSNNYDFDMTFAKSVNVFVKIAKTQPEIHQMIVRDESFDHSGK